jgi:hypothetical protein
MVGALAFLLWLAFQDGGEADSFGGADDDGVTQAQSEG